LGLRLLAADAILWSGAVLVGVFVGWLWSLLGASGGTPIPVGIVAGVLIARVLLPSIGNGRRPGR
jgi:hypothetical protein